MANEKAGIAINGGGRIGLQFLRHHIRELENSSSKINNGIVKLINEPFAAADNIGYLLTYDSVHGKFEYPVCVVDDHTIKVKGSKTEYVIKLTKEMDPTKIPYAEYEIKVVVECTGKFTAEDKAKQHLHDGVEKVLISAPGSGAGVFTCVLGVNCDKLNFDKHQIISNASCTTNCLAPLVKVIDDNFKINWGTMTTTHASTQTQKVVDGVSAKDLAGGRSVFNNIIPASTGAAKAIGLVMPHLNGKIDGSALRVPTPNVSFCDFVCGVEKACNVEEINAAFEKASQNGSLKGILGIAHKGSVSMDFCSDPRSSILAPNCTLSLNGGKTVKVGAYYDNEYGYSMRLFQLAMKAAAAK